MNEIGRKITDKLIELHGSKDFSIAFLPYKRSMWNSMQSVYEECKISGIDAHIYPIPYKCLKENKEVDYIGNDFKFFGLLAEPIEDLKHADYIAIHYQYEDHNKVTNMFPEYFTKSLKERYGAKIIFLPYGIAMGEWHFALQPGCRDVDYAFLESEEQAEKFIAGWLTQGVDFTGRVFGYGSAKLDIARSLDRFYPGGWEPSTNKHVTLVCNSLGPFLSDPFGKLRRYQMEISNEIGKGRRMVIFRPHPLLFNMIRSMRPDVTSAFDKFIDWCCFRDYVYIDTSEYLERAMAYADELISDMSSVVVMWKETGKPYRLME